MRSIELSVISSGIMSALCSHVTTVYTCDSLGHGCRAPGAHTQRNLTDRTFICCAHGDVDTVWLHYYIVLFLLQYLSAIFRGIKPLTILLADEQFH